MKTYTYTVTAGAPLILPFSGRQFFLMDAAYPVDVEFFDASHQNAGEKLEAIPSGSWAEPENGFSSLRLTSGTTQSVKFIISTGRAGVFRIAGDVSFIDGGKARTIAGAAFLGGVSNTTLAGQYPYVQLFNPVASTQRVIIEQVIFCSDLAGSIYIYPSVVNTPLANLYGVQPANKNAGSATASAAELRWATNASIVINQNMLISKILANVTAPPLLLREPIVLRPGYGLVLMQNVVAAVIAASFEFFEEPNI